MPRVLVDALSARVGGGLSYLVEQLGAVERVRPDLDLHVLVAPWNESLLRPHLRSRIVPVRLPNVPARFAWEQTVLPLRARHHDLLYCPGNFCPLAPGGTPIVLTVQNSNYFGAARHHPHNRAPGRRGKVALAQASARRADAVVLISHTLESQVVEDLGPRDSFEVLHSGAPTWPDEPSERPLPAPEGTYLISVANDYPHKRLELVVAAWARACADGTTDLVLAGDIAEERRTRLRAAAGAHVDRLHLLGPVADRAWLRDLVAGAVAQVSASVQEAFPLGPAEAGSVGTPLVLTDLPSHREVAMGHGRLVPPDDLDALASALAAAVAEGGRDRWSWPTTWDDHARALVALWERAATS